MSKKFEQQVKYSIQLKAKVAQLLDTRGGDADVDRIRRLEASLSDAHADLNNALVKVAKLESQLGQELSMKVGQMATTDSPNQDKITFLQELLNKKKVEMEEMRRELDQSRFHLRAESVKSSGVERELYDAKREAEVWKRKIIKLDVDVRRLKLKCGEEVQQKPLVKKGNVEIIGDCDITEKENISSEIKTSTPTSDAQQKLGSDAHLKPKQASVPTECKQQ
uniref:Uncharacterized protein n=1 Tax=Ciona savignyi TaxID=51511 RepID=H2YM39_CIOSA